MARTRKTDGKSNVGLQLETIRKVKAIADAWEAEDQISRTFPTVVTTLVNKAYDKYCVNSQNE